MGTNPATALLRLVQMEWNENRPGKLGHREVTQDYRTDATNRIEEARQNSSVELL